MNLGKLLAAGKSIIGGRGEVSYRIGDRGYLPKFISPKNPFVPAVKTEPAPKADGVPVKKGLASDGAKTQKLPAFAAARIQKRTWAGKWNPISIWRSARTPAPLKAQCPMQAELSLDRVKVVHNDLTDADVEIVPIKSRTAPEMPILPPAHPGDSWSRLSAKIFGVKAA
ncbi:MAG TPA: hypothetical protein VMA35_12635 [Candidatus Sulfopaludibacter sp.]|nr:hypothetical protein [Candidatus Sulfopaludibacter sp.]